MCRAELLSSLLELELVLELELESSELVSDPELVLEFEFELEFELVLEFELEFELVLEFEFEFELEPPTVKGSTFLPAAWHPVTKATRTTSASHVSWDPDKIQKLTV